MKLVLDNFNTMTGGHMPGTEDFRHKKVEGFVPHYFLLAREDQDSNFKQKINPPYPLVRNPGASIVAKKAGREIPLMLANESDALGDVIYTTDLWEFFSTDGTSLGIPSGSPSSRGDMDAVIFNGEILTSHATNSNLYHAAIEDSPTWSATTGGSLATVKHVLKVIEDRCLLTNASSGAFTRNDEVKLVKPDWSIISGIALGDTFNIMDIGNFQDRYAVLFCEKTTTPKAMSQTWAFTWNTVPGDSYEQKIPLSGIYKTSIEKDGILYAFTEVGQHLVCWAFTGNSFEEIGRIRNIEVEDAPIPKSVISSEGDFFVLRTSTLPLYWNPRTGEAFYLLPQLGDSNSQLFSLLVTQDGTGGEYLRFFSVENEDNSAIYKVELHNTDGVDLVTDGYNEANRDTTRSLVGASEGETGFQAVGQSFTARGGKIRSASFYLKKTGSPTGVMRARLYSHSGTFGTSSVPDTLLETSEVKNTSEPDDTDFEVLTFEFTTQTELTANEKYVITIEPTEGDSSNYLSTGVDGTGNTHSGNLATKSNDSWSADSSADLIFYVTEEFDLTADYESNYIPAPIVEDHHDYMGRMQIKNIEVEYAVKPPSSSDTLTLTLTTKDEHESETYTTLNATISDTDDNSTNAKVTDKRGIIKSGATATEFAIDLSANINTRDWNCIVRRIVIDYQPLAIKN